MSGEAPRLSVRERLVARLRDLEEPGALAEAALLIAAEEYPALDVAAWLARLDALGARARERVPPRGDADQTAAALTRLLVEDYGLRGNDADYYDPRNSFLNEVLERRLGIPLTLSLVYMEVGARAGVAVRGVGLPGHFVVRLERGETVRHLDPYNGGRPLDEADCRRLVERLGGGRLRFEPAYLRAVSAREILIRMLANWKGVYTALGDWRRARGAVDRILLLAPEAVGELRDRGLLSARLGEPVAAIGDWEAYLRRVPDAKDAATVRRHLRALRQAQAALN